MNHPTLTLIGKLLSRRLSVIILLLVVGATAFATLGDGKSKSTRTTHGLLTDKSTLAPGSFSLKSGYQFRGSDVINQKADNFISLNMVVTYQKGHTTYVMPLKKKVLNHITFNPNPATRGNY